MKEILRPASLVQKLVNGTVIAKRTNKNTGEKEFLFKWIGYEGEIHKIWYPESKLKFED